MPDERAMPIPPGRTRCPACGEYRSSTRARYFDWNNLLDASELDNGVKVSCLCEGILCRSCGKMMHRPISDYYYERTNSVYHVPYFVGMFPCRECRSRERPE